MYKKFYLIYIVFSLYKKGKTSWTFCIKRGRESNFKEQEKEKEGKETLELEILENIGRGKRKTRRYLQERWVDREIE